MVSYNVTNVWGLIVFFLCSFAALAFLALVKVTL